MKEKNIQNQYQKKINELIQQSESDHELKKEVMSTISRIDSLLEIIDLFSNKFVVSNATMLDGMFKTKNNIQKM
jgi:hypothetical protein